MTRSTAREPPAAECTPRSPSAEILLSGDLAPHAILTIDSQRIGPAHAAPTIGSVSDATESTLAEPDHALTLTIAEAESAEAEHPTGTEEEPTLAEVSL